MSFFVNYPILGQNSGGGSGQPQEFVHLDFSFLDFVKKLSDDNQNQEILTTQKQRDAVGLTSEAMERIRLGAKVRAKFVPLYIDEDGKVEKSETIVTCQLSYEERKIYKQKKSVVETDITCFLLKTIFLGGNSFDFLVCFFDVHTGSLSSVSQEFFDSVLENEDVIVINPFIKQPLT